MASGAQAQSAEVRSIVSQALTGQGFDILENVTEADELTSEAEINLLAEANRLRADLSAEPNPLRSREKNIRFLELVIMDLRSYHVKLKRETFDPSSGIEACSQKPIFSMAEFSFPPIGGTIRLTEFPWSPYGSWQLGTNDKIWNSIAKEVWETFLFGNTDLNKLNEIKLRREYSAMIKNHGQSPFQMPSDRMGTQHARFIKYYQRPLYCIVAENENIRYEMEDMKVQIQSLLGQR